MKTPSHRGRAAFTLIELMAVITIIVILAGIVVAGMGYVNEKQASSKAKVQIALLSKAIEEFKLDYGFYPPGKKNATTGTIEQDTNAQNSNGLYKSLYWDTDFDGVGAIKKQGAGTVRDDEDQKIYLNELDPVWIDNKATNKMGWVEVFGAAATIKDPWGKPYNYRLGSNTNAQNPDFDLWSNGKDEVADPTNKIKDDIRNF